VARFKGLGEMPAIQLRETTMDPARRALLRIQLPDAADEGEHEALREVGRLVDRLMGRKAEDRFRFIQDNAEFVEEVDI